MIGYEKLTFCLRTLNIAPVLSKNSCIKDLLEGSGFYVCHKFNSRHSEYLPTFYSKTVIDV